VFGQRFQPCTRPAAAERACAEQLLADLLRAGTDPTARGVMLSVGGWRVRVEAAPSRPEELAPDLNECGRAVLRLLWDAYSPLSAEKVRDKLEAEGQVFGLITVKRPPPAAPPPASTPTAPRLSERGFGKQGEVDCQGTCLRKKSGVKGETNDEIARQLQVSPTTVERKLCGCRAILVKVLAE
jgi:hypothetical protein